MTLGEAFRAIEFFLFDLFALLIPGLTVLILFALLVAPGPGTCWTQIIGAITLVGWLLIGTAAYVTGYVLQSLGEGLEWLLDRTVTSKAPWYTSRDAVEAQFMTSVTFGSARDTLSAYAGVELEKAEFHEIRNLAISVAPERTHDWWRFVYASHLCLGGATAVLIVMVCLVARLAIEILAFRTVALWWEWCVVPVLAVSAVALLDRRQRYLGIARRIPFNIALAKIAEGKAVKADK